MCVLALLMVRVAELSTKTSWPRIRHALSTLQATEFRTNSHRFLRRSEPTAEAKGLLSAMEIELPRRVLGAEPLQQSLTPA